ncbi:MAG: L-2-amino-thiazoline-4-carboxylic acid hydrolase [Clostridiaceae bacterium]|jgi:hypothetical protein|nr:L-2-amino-thiazoline-4-carboxylic acid hydrolase [Clostridiaceae bacterium]
MKHEIKLCDNQAQDQWAALYLKMACALADKYGMHGKGVIREGVRRYAAVMAKQRNQQLINTDNKTNLETFFDGGFGLPCGNRARKEWIKHSEQELRVNIVSCPYADYWGGDTREIGRMFCEEYYPVLVHAGISEKAQINLGYTMLNGRDNSCCLSIYLRPANLCTEQRRCCFKEFDSDWNSPSREAEYTPNFEEQKSILFQAFLASAQECMHQDCVDLIKKAAADYAAENDDDVIAKLALEYSAVK